MFNMYIFHMFNTCLIHMLNTCALFMCLTCVLFLYVKHVLNMCLTHVDIFPVYVPFYVIYLNCFNILSYFLFEFKTILVSSIIRQINTIAFGSVPVFATAILADSRNMIADGFRFTTAALLCTVGSVKSIFTHCNGKTYRQNKLCMRNPVNVRGSLKIRRQLCPFSQTMKH